MPIFTRPRDSFEYILKAERDLPEDGQTIFLLADLKERHRVKIMDSFRVQVSDGDDGTSVGGSGSRIYMAVKYGLVGWKNAKYPDGTPVPFETESGGKTPTDDTLSMLSWADKMELAEVVLEAAYPSEDDAGK